MSAFCGRLARVSAADAAFVAGAVGASAEALKQALERDLRARASVLTDERVVQRVLGRDDVLVRITPSLFFEVLLRQAARDLGRTPYTLERTGTVRVPVFDAGRVCELLEDHGVVLYLADMLASFTRVRSYTFTFRLGEGLWRTIRFHDMDLEGLKAFVGVAPEAWRLPLYKRIADVCLFLTGLYPDHLAWEARYPLSREPRPRLPGRWRWTTRECEEEGRKHYRLGAEHDLAGELGMRDVLLVLAERFEEARKVLEYLAAHYLCHRKDRLFH